MIEQNISITPTNSSSRDAQSQLVTIKKKKNSSCPFDEPSTFLGYQSSLQIINLVLQVLGGNIISHFFSFLTDKFYSFALQFSQHNHFFFIFLIDSLPFIVHPKICHNHVIVAPTNPSWILSEQITYLP